MPMILQKGQQEAVVRADGTPVVNFTCGAAWGKINKAGKSEAAGFFGKILGAVGAGEVLLESVDLDLSVLFFNSQRELVDKCYFGRKNLFNNGVQHSGDDLEGSDSSDGSTDNERIKVSGMALPAQVTTAFVVVNSFRHHKFDEIPFILISMYDGIANLSAKAERLMEFKLHNDKSFAGAEAAIMARIDKTAKGFVLTAVGQPTNDTSISGLVSSCQRIM